MNHPIIIGAGQITLRQKIVGDTPCALDLAQRAIEAAVKDAGCPDILSLADTISLVNMFSDANPHQVERLCDQMGIQPKVRENTAIGGNTPQWLVNRTADKLMAGGCKIVILAGAEAYYRQKRREQIMSAESLESRVEQLRKDPWCIGNMRNGVGPNEQTHGLSRPQRVYTLFENALRAHLKMDLLEYRAFLKRYYDNMAATAFGNPHAWFNKGPVHKDVTTPSADNPIFNYPYTKYMYPNPSVNQGAAIIMTDTDTAGRLSIPRDRWVYLHGGADASDKWFLSERINYHSSPAIRRIVRTALQQAGRTLTDIDFFDLYSCFPCSALIAAQEIGLPIKELPRLSITGGLPYFGGPGNNYTMHAIVAAVDRLRKEPEKFGLVSGVGWFLTKHTVGIYSGVKPANEWRRDAKNALQMEIETMEGPAFCAKPHGQGSVETYTVLHEMPDKPPMPIIIARLDSGERCYAVSAEDSSTVELMEQEEFIGRRVNIRPGRNSLASFSIH